MPKIFKKYVYSFKQADVRIADPNPMYEDAPYTLQYGGRGQPGEYIHLTENYIMKDSFVQKYGEKGEIYLSIDLNFHSKLNARNSFFLLYIIHCKCKTRIS